MMERLVMVMGLLVVLALVYGGMVLAIRAVARGRGAEWLDRRAEDLTPNPFPEGKGGEEE